MAAPLFLDRDGVINADSEDFIKSVDEWIPLPGSLEAIARLCEIGYQLVVITNQSGIARGLFDESVLERIHQRMTCEIEAAGGRLAGIYHCPHAPGAGCRCRKPETGLIDQACRELGLTARGAPMIGDRRSDVGAARSAGCRPILVRSGLGSPSRGLDPGLENVEAYRDLAEAVDALVAESRRGRE